LCFLISSISLIPFHAKAQNGKSAVMMDALKTELSRTWRTSKTSPRLLIF
jgi:hypothetical protein